MPLWERAAMITCYAILIGFLLDAIYGDPNGLPHPVVAMGKLISWLEKVLRKLFAKTKKTELLGGAILAVCLTFLSFAIPFVLLHFLGRVNMAIRLIVESFMCYQIFAMRCLSDESTAVYRKVVANDLQAAQNQVSRIVGRDTASLSMKGVIKATVETVAENTSDGVIAPLFFVAIGGAPLGFLYKAINTMDSMIGYKNQRYLYFGRVAAMLDDVANFIPSRLAGILMVCSAWLCKLNYKAAWRIFLRDRKNHASPNSAQTEAACAGALEIQLAGDASYFGKILHKPTIGDDMRDPEAEDILRTNRLMYATSVLSLLLLVGARIFGEVFFWS